MPVTATYPGVYIEEIPSGVRTITGVSTSVTAFVGFLRRGPMNKPVQIFSMADFEREFGGLDTESEVSYAAQQFFLNGGTEAWVVRTASGSTAATLQILGNTSGALALTVRAASEGSWGNNLRIDIDYDTVDPLSSFNMTVAEHLTSGGVRRVARSEVFRNLSMASSHPRFVESVMNDQFSGSKLVRISANGTDRPLQNGSVSGDLATFAALTSPAPAVKVAVGGEGTFTATFSDKPTTLAGARSTLEAAIRASKTDNPTFSSATVEIIHNRLRILAGPTSPGASVTFTALHPDPALTELGLDSPTQAEGVFSGDLTGFAGLSQDPTRLQVSIGGEGPHEVTISGAPTDLYAARAALEAGIQGAHASAAFTGTRVATVDDRLLVIPGASGDVVTFSASGSDPALAELGLDSPTHVEGVFSGDLTGFAGLSQDPAHLQVTISGEGPHEVAIAGAPSGLYAARAALEAGIQGAHASAAFTGTRIATVDDRLLVLTGAVGDVITFAATSGDTTTVSELRLDAANGAIANVQEYSLATGAIPNTAQGSGSTGEDGNPPNGSALIGNPNNKTGIYALNDVGLFNMLCIPRTAALSGTHALSASEARAVITTALSYCEERRAFFIMDTPDNVDEVEEIKAWLNATARHKNAAVYFPRVQIPDPLNDFRLRSVGASGTIAGLYARTDSTRGVWKAPAGTEATLRGVQALDYKLTDQQNGTLNKTGINCLRTFPVYGKVSWGARTLEGSDQQASEWKYIPVRRLALFIEESLYRGTQWVVFEPNDEPLWAQIRLNIGAFMHNLFRQAAFQGKTPREAYLVKCDKETTTQTDINQGIVNILVGFAPLKPAEFVIIKIQQLAGQIET